MLLQNILHFVLLQNVIAFDHLKLHAITLQYAFYCMHIYNPVVLIALHYCVKVKLSPIYPYVGNCLLERPLVLDHRLYGVGWPIHYPPSASTRTPFAAGLAVWEYPTLGWKWVSNRGSSAQLALLCILGINGHYKT